LTGEDGFQTDPHRRRPFIVLATGASADSEELLFLPNVSDIGPSQFDQRELCAKSSSAIKQENNSTKCIPLAFPLIDWHSFDTDFTKNIGGGNGFDNSRDGSSIRGLTNPNDQFRFGNSYLGIQTQKSLQTFEPFRRADCATDDECADYSGLPKSEPPKKTMKNLRKPFFGLSITTPLR
jgi:hypothetical protein